MASWLRLRLIAVRSRPLGYLNTYNELGFVVLNIVLHFGFCEDRYSNVKSTNS
jgi:hypothetical protein